MKNTKNLAKRSLALLLVLVMCMSLVNITAFAVEGEDETTSIEETEGAKVETEVTEEETTEETGETKKETTEETEVTKEDATEETEVTEEETKEETEVTKEETVEETEVTKEDTEEETEETKEDAEEITATDPDGVAAIRDCACLVEISIKNTNTGNYETFKACICEDTGEETECACCAYQKAVAAVGHVHNAGGWECEYIDSFKVLKCNTSAHGDFKNQGVTGVQNLHNTGCFKTVDVYDLEQCTKDESTKTVDSFQALKEAIEGATEPLTIRITDESGNGSWKIWSETITIPAGKEITLLGGAETIRRANGFTGKMLEVQGKLTLGEIKLGGLFSSSTYKDASLVHVAAGGTLVLDNGATLTSNYANENGGGVNNEGTVTMKSGSAINSNQTTKYGGGVWNKGAFTMESGSSISGNRTSSFAGGVFNVGGTFTMNGGEISNNKATGTSSGGGVYTYSTNAEFIMNGGKITGNSTGGSGAGLYNGATFTMNGGEISGNTAASNGGGVYSTGPFTAFNATISGNDAGKTAGGVYVSGTTELTNTVIKNNTSASGVGGVYVTGSLNYVSGALYSNKGGLMNSEYVLANDLIAVTGKTYSLPAASAMKDGSVDFGGYVWYNGECISGAVSSSDTMYLTACPEADAEVMGHPAQTKATIVGGEEYGSLAAAVAAAESGAVITVNTDESSSILPVVIDRDITIKFAEGQKLLALSKTLFTVENGATLTLQGPDLSTATYSKAAKFGGTITVNDGCTLTMDGAVMWNYTYLPDLVHDLTVNVREGGSFNINGKIPTAVLGYDPSKYPNGPSGYMYVNLAKDTYINAGENFSAGTVSWIIVSLDKNVFAEINGDSEEPMKVTLVKGTEDANLLNWLYIYNITNPNVKIATDDGDIVLRKSFPAEGIYVSSSGDDTKGTGDETSPVKTLDKAMKLLEEKNKDAESADDIIDTIYLQSAVSLSEEFNGTLDEETGLNVTLMRGPGNTSNLITVASGKEVTLTNVTLDGGSKEYGSKKYQSLVSVSSGGTLTLGKGAVLQNNDVSGNTEGNTTYKYGGGVYVNGTLIMEDGAVIQNCTAENGGGVAIITTNVTTGKMTMNGGLIDNNTATKNGGGIAIPHVNSDVRHVLDVLGGTVSNNKANGGNGGGIYVQAGNSITIGGSEKKEPIYITGNYASGGGNNFAGGGLYVNDGDGAYPDGVAYLYDVLITGNKVEDNTNGYTGGGIAGCGSSIVKIYPNSAVIYGNTATNGKSDVLINTMRGDGVAVGFKTSKDMITALMLGNGAFNWKSTEDDASFPLDKLDADEGALNLVKEADKVIDAATGLIEPAKDPTLELYSEANGTIQAAAAVGASVIITGNTGGKNGGGIGTNGTVIIGGPSTYGTTGLTVEKTWSDGNEKHEADEIEVLIQRAFSGVTETVTTVSLSKDNDWTAEVKGLPEGYTYTVKEAGEQDGAIMLGESSYKVAYAYGEGGKAAITNTLLGSLKITNTVVGGPADPIEYTYTVTGPDGYEKTVTIKGSGEVVLNDLLPGTYTVTQTNGAISGYSWTCTVGGANGTEGNGTVPFGGQGLVEFVNTYKGNSNPGGGHTRDPRPDPDPDPNPNIPDEDPPLSEIPDEDPPLAGIPDEDPPLAEIPDEDPPKVELPDEDPPKAGTPSKDTVTIKDKDVPLASVPKTGDESAVWFYLAILSGASLFCLVALELKKFRKN